MDTIIITQFDDVHLHVDCCDGVAYELSDYFKFRVPNYKFMPAYKSKIWDGYIRLFCRRKKTLYVGLLKYLLDIIKKRNYSFVIDSNITPSNNITTSMASEYYNTLSLPTGIIPHKHQIFATKEALTRERCILLSPTASGKSLIIYSILRYYNKKSLVIVPTTSLVSQMYGDFMNYSINDPTFNAESNCHQIMEGRSKVTNKQIVVSTWQSIYTQPKKWFNRFDVVVGDEVHSFKAKSLVGIMEKCTEVRHRFGTTGTLNDSQTHKLVLEGLFGGVVNVTNTKTLMDQKQLSKLIIKCIVLKYCDIERRATSGQSYPDEIKFITRHDKRNNFIADLAIKRNKNTLVLFQLKKHGKRIHELIEQKFKNTKTKRKLFYVAGETPAKERENIRKMVETETGCIIVASYGVYSTGINIKNLYNIIFASPSKSKIKVLQSIGRGLRLGKESLDVFLFDIADDLSWKFNKNYTMRHLYERIKIYKREKFEHIIRIAKMPQDK